MKTFEEIKFTLQKQKAYLTAKYKVKEIGIFGSFVRGEQNKNSDLDVLVEFCEPVDFFAFLDLEEYLKRLIKIKIDLISKKALKPYIGKYILEEVVYL